MKPHPALRTLLCWLAGAALPTAVGCGAPEAPGTTTADAAAVNPDDPVAWDAFLRSLDVTPAPREDLGTERAAAGSGAFLIYPLGEVRKEGLRNFRFDVTPDFDAKGTLRFTKGSKTLHEAPFDPAALTKDAVVAALPAAVVDGLRTGDSVRWGLFFGDRRVKDVVGTFVLVDKPAATKDLLKKVEGNRTLAAAPAVKALARAEILLNYSLYAEAVQELTEAAALDATLTAPYLPLANALRRLKLKDSPLYDHAMRHAVARKGNAVAGEPGPERARLTPPLAPKAPAVASPGPSLAPHGTGPADLGTAGPAKSADGAAAGGPPATAAALLDARRRYEATRQLVEAQVKRTEQVAADLRVRSAAAQAQAESALAKAEALRKQADDLRAQVSARPDDADLVAKATEAEKARAEADQAAQAAARTAKALLELSEAAGLRARETAQAIHPPVLAPVPGGPVPPAVPAGGAAAARATQALQAAVDGADRAARSLEAAQAALEAARTAVEKDLVDGTADEPGDALAAAEAAYGKAQQDLVQALGQVDAAHRAHDLAQRDGR